MGERKARKMQRLYENICYLRKMFTEFHYEETTKEGRMFGFIIDTLEEMTDAINYLSEEHPLFEHLESTYTCPNCAKSIEIEPDVMEQDRTIVCPLCHETVTILTRIEF